MAELRVSVEATSRDGQRLAAQLPPLAVQGTRPEPALVPAAPEAAPEEPVPAEESGDAEDGQTRMLMLFGAANLLVLLIGGAIFWFIRRHRAKDPIQLVDDDDAVDGAAKGGDA